LLFIICYLLFIIYYLLFIIYYLLFIIYYLFLIINYYLLFIIYYLLFIIYYLLFIIYYLLFYYCYESWKKKFRNTWWVPISHYNHNRYVTNWYTSTALLLHTSLYICLGLYSLTFLHISPLIKSQEFMVYNYVNFIKYIIW